MPSKYNHTEWLRRYETGKKAADFVSNSISERGWKLAAEAGITSHMLNMISNAIISYNDGRPWSEVKDIKKLKEANYLLNVKCFEPYRLLDKWDARIR